VPPTPWRPLVLIGIPAAITRAALVHRVPVWSRFGYVVIVTASALLSVAALTCPLGVLRRRADRSSAATRAAV